METLAFAAIPDATLHIIAARHGLAVGPIRRLPQVGMINAIYALGDDYVLRVPRAHPGAIAQARAEVVAAPTARAAGVRTPRLVAFGEADDVLDRPYLIYERVHGRNLGVLAWEPAALGPVWRALGQDLALLHAAPTVAGLRMETPGDDPRALAEARAAEGWFTGLEVRWLTRWLDRLAPALAIPIPSAPLHLDVQATNIMVAATDWEYNALLDWGCAGQGDPAWDCFGLPLRAIPDVLTGHRAIAPLPDDDGAEARILWRHLQFALAVLPRGAAPGLSWGERPLAWLLEVFRFFAEHPDQRWRELRP